MSLSLAIYPLDNLSSPDHDPTINAACAELGHTLSISVERSNGANGVLVDRLELSVVLGLALQIHLSEHVKGRLLAVLTQAGAALCLDGTSQLPTTLTSLEAEGLAVITGSNDLVLTGPDQTLERQLLSCDSDNSAGRLLRSRGIHNRDAAVVSSKGKAITARGERNRVNPASRVVKVLSTDSVEWESLAPNSGSRTGVHPLDEGGKDSGVGIGGAGGKEDRVRVPGNARDGAANGLLEMLGNPPVVLLLKVADGDDAVAGADGELGLGRRPAHKRGSSADSEQNESRLVTGRRGLPDQGVTVLRAGHNAPAVGSNVDTRDSFVVALELILQLVGIADLAVKLNSGVASDGEDGMISRERVVGDGVVEEVVNFGSGHGEGIGDRSSSLLSLSSRLRE